MGTCFVLWIGRSFFVFWEPSRICRHPFHLIVAYELRALVRFEIYFRLAWQAKMGLDQCLQLSDPNVSH